MKRVTRVVSLALLALVAVAAVASAADAKWMVRLRAVDLLMSNVSDAGSGALNATLLPEDAVSVNDKVIPDVNVSYFFTPNVSAELVLTYPQEQTVTVENGPLKEEIGTFKHLPPTLLLQYRFLPTGKVQPYIGAGVNLTLISNVSLHSTPGAADLDLSSSSVGPAGQIGADFPIQKNWYANIDVKKVFIHSDVEIGGSKVSHVSLDPWLIGAGVGIRF